MTGRVRSLLGICGAVLIAVGFVEVAGSLALKAKCPPTKQDIPLVPGQYVPLVETGYRVPPLMHGEYVNILFNAGAREPSMYAAGEMVNEPLNADYLALKDFRIENYPSGKVSQYVSEVQLFSPFTNTMHNASISVNHPLIWRDWWIYQMSYDPSVEKRTILMAVRDRWLPLAAAGGVFLVLGSLLFGLTSFLPVRKRGTACECKASGDASAPDMAAECQCGKWNDSGKRSLIPGIICGVLAVSVPIFIIGRSMMRPDPMPALRSPLMAPHVASYAASYVVLLFATFGVGKRWMPFGWFLMTLGLVLGALWGKICWGDFWQYDPKEMWSLATWSVYAAYFAFRRFRVPEIVLRYAGGVSIILTLTWVNFSKLFTGLHSYA